MFPAPALQHLERRAAFIQSVQGGNVGIVFLQSKRGDEISISPTDRSPELAFDATLVQLLWDGQQFTFGRYGILELQTMDYHGSYRYAVANLQRSLRMHGAEFPAQLQENQRWLSDHIEGPNIANVFKRTFYQIMLKFQIGADETCTGCVLALPASVWDSPCSMLLLRTGRRFQVRPPYVFPTTAPRVGQDNLISCRFDHDAGLLRRLEDVVEIDSHPSRVRLHHGETEASGKVALSDPGIPRRAVAALALGGGSLDDLLEPLHGQMFLMMGMTRKVEMDPAPPQHRSLEQGPGASLVGISAVVAACCRPGCDRTPASTARDSARHIGPVLPTRSAIR